MKILKPRLRLVVVSPEKLDGPSQDETLPLGSDAPPAAQIPEAKLIELLGGPVEPIPTVYLGIWAFGLRDAPAAPQAVNELATWALATAESHSRILTGPVAIVTTEAAVCMHHCAEGHHFLSEARLQGDGSLAAALCPGCGALVSNLGEDVAWAPIAGCEIPPSERQGYGLGLICPEGHMHQRPAGASLTSILQAYNNLVRLGGRAEVHRMLTN